MKILVGPGWRLEFESEHFPLCAWNANPCRLLRQLVIDELVRLMQDDSCFRSESLKRCYRSDVVQVRVRHHDRLKLERKFIDRIRDSLGFVTGINTDGAPRFLASHNTRVLLESCNRDLFDDHVTLPVKHNYGLGAKLA